jgi:hypothetical protein
VDDQVNENRRSCDNGESQPHENWRVGHLRSV